MTAIDSFKISYLQASKQAFLFTLITLLSIHHTFNWGLGLVGPTFLEGALRFSQGISPYLPPPGPTIDWFQYPPFFAWIYYPLTLLSPYLHGLVWMAINAFFFWLGMSRWVPLSLSDKRNLKWHLLFFALCAMEMEMAVRYRQNNALHTGSILLGVREFVDRRDWRAASWLMLGTGIKVLPIIFVFLLLFPIRPRFWLASLVMGLVVVVSPGITAGFWGIEMFPSWVRHMLKIVVPTEGQQDIGSMLVRLGVPQEIGQWVRQGILLLTGFVLVRSRLKLREPFPWELWIPLTFMGILLCSPKTEEPSFVMFAPFCAFFGMYLRRVGVKAHRTEFLGYVLAMMLVSGVHNDLFFLRKLSPIFQFSTLTKPYGALVAWLVLMMPLVDMLRRQPR